MDAVELSCIFEKEECCLVLPSQGTKPVPRCFPAALPVLSVPPVESPREGKRRTISGFSTIRQGQIMARLTSTEPQFTGVARKKVTSGFSPSLVKADIRTMETTQMLYPPVRSLAQG